MYAIVSIAGQQFKVEKGKKVFVHRLSGEVGEEVSFDKVLLISRDDKTDVGVPYLPDAMVLAQIVSHIRGDKVLVFHKKRKKGYQKLNGHRQNFTQLLIEDISETGASERKEKMKEAVPQVKASADTVKSEAKPKKETAAVKPVKKKPAKAKSASEKKPKKVTAKKTPAAAAKPAAKKAPAKDKAKEKK